MSSRIQRCERVGLITPPTFLADNLVYETISGSISYGVATDTSDEDIYAITIPPKDVLFPHLKGHIQGFHGDDHKFWSGWQKHHIKDAEARKEYDFNVYNIARYFWLCYRSNPNMVDTLFTPRECVVHSTKVGEMIRENRHLFLSKKVWITFKGYAYGQLNKMAKKDAEGARIELIEKYGYDTKFAYNVVRLLDECEQILMNGDIDLQRNREQLKSIRRGEWTEEQIRSWAADKERQLEEMHAKSELPNEPNRDKIHKLLLECLEEHYGDLSAAVTMPDRADQALLQIQEITNKYMRYKNGSGN